MISVPAVAASRRTTRSQKPRLSAELLGKVATYSSLGRDLLNLCVVAGPRDCAVIRHAYLRNNLRYLEATIRKFVKDDEDRNGDYFLNLGLCRGRYLAWMEVNTDWRRLVTAERVDSLVSVYKEDNEGNFTAIVDPLLPFNNPAVAIEFGLMDSLMYLVEEMGIDVNAYRWTTFADDPTLCVHLLMICVGSVNFSAFQYLLRRERICVCSKAQEKRHHGEGSPWRLEGEDLQPFTRRTPTILEQCFIYPNRTAFFSELLRHPTCSLDAGFSLLISDFQRRYMDPTYAHSAIFFMNSLIEEDMFDSSTWNANFRLLLAAGVDKDARDHHGRDILQDVKFRLAEAGDGSLLQKALKDTLQILEDWVATK